MKRAPFLLVLAALWACLPLPALADYLASAVPPETMPRVLFVIDNSGSMESNKIGGKTRIQIVKETVDELIPTLDGVEMGLVAFTDGRSKYKNMDYCGAKQYEAIGASRESLRAAVNKLQAKYNTPIAASLEVARTTLQQVIAADDSAACRKYFVIYLSDGEENCGGDPESQTKQLRQVNVVRPDGTTIRKDVKTFVVGFGDGAVGSSMLNKMARAGGTAVNSSGDFVCPDTGTCNTGSALSALTRTELKSALRRALERVVAGEFTSTTPIIGTVATRATEVDRVARNFMAYPSFRMPGRQGHLYGIRLFEEAEEWSNVWEFAKLESLDLDKCGYDYATGKNPYDPANPCLYDAGRMLTERTKTGSTARRILAGTWARIHRENGGFTLEMSSEPRKIEPDNGNTIAELWSKIRKTEGISTAFGKLPNVFSALETSDGRKMSDLFDATSSKLTTADFRNVSRWLHGIDPEGSLRGRSWDLGDIYHSSPAIVEAPPQPYTDRGYPRFRSRLQTRPQMIYVGANDGMIHAFYAGPDVHYKKLGLTKPRWMPGEEAWAYLPLSMVTKTIAAVTQGEERFTSMDLSCRVDDVQLDTSYTNENCDPSVNPDADPYCGWRTVLICGQGWGGNWYVALDVSDSLDPKPLWEFTADGPGSLGRTWAVPSVALVNNDDQPRWLAIFGNGYNSDSGDCFRTTGGSDGSGGSGGGTGGGGSGGGGGGSPPPPTYQYPEKDATCSCSWNFLSGTTCDWTYAWEERYVKPQCMSEERRNNGRRGKWCSTQCSKSPLPPPEPPEDDPDVDDGEEALPGQEIPPTQPLGCSNAAAAYHWLNLPYDGDFADHGNGTQGDKGYLWLLDMGTGRVLRRLDAHQMIDIVTNIPIIDTDADGVADVGYVGGWNGELARLVLAKDRSDSTVSSPGNWKLCQGNETFTRMSHNQPITVRPSAFADPYNPNHVFLFVGSGVDRGLHLDEAGYEGGVWEYRAFYVEDDGSASCAPTWDRGNLCADSSTGETWQMASLARADSKARLIGAPVVVQQGSGSRSVYYTTWDPPEADNICGEGVTTVACMKLDRSAANPSYYTCSFCLGLNGSEDPLPVVEVETGRAKPTTPAVADGRVYLVTDKGPISLTADEKTEANTFKPQVQTVSWRETF